MTCSIIWMSWREILLGKRLNGKKNYTSPWSLHDRSCPNLIMKLLQYWVYISFQHISSILCRNWDCLGSGTREWILILMIRLLILYNTKKCFWSRRRICAVPNMNIYQSLNLKDYRATILSPPQPLLHLVHLLWFIRLDQVWWRILNA